MASSLVAKDARGRQKTTTSIAQIASFGAGRLSMKVHLWLQAAIFIPLNSLHLLGVSAQVPLPSPAWLPPPAASGAVASPNSNRPNGQWSTLLGELLYFYDAQRSGKL